MSGNQEYRGRREAPGGFSPKKWWSDYRAWVAGLDRRARIRYRVFQVLAVIAVLVIALCLFLRSWMRLPDVPDPPGFNNNPNGGNTSQSQPGQTGDVSFEGAELPDVARSGRKEGYYTFLLCGRDVVSGATDTMILITYDTKGQSISAISLLRDTMTNTSAKRGAQKRLNVVFARNQGDSKLSEKERTENGMAALKKEVSRLTGIYPDFYVLVEWEAIGRLVDAIDGVYFEVPYDMDYDDPTPGQDLHIHQKAGYRLLDGQDAMEVIRFRKNNDESIKLGDSGRTQIQRDFLTAVLKKCLTPEILLKLPSLVQIFTENVDTDLTVGNILALAQLAVGMDVENNVKFDSMPYDNTAYQGAALALVREKEMLELLNSGLNPYADNIKSSDLQLMYKKSGGGFGVTNGALADPAVAQVHVPKPDPVEPDKSDEDPGTDTDPGTEPDPSTTDPSTTDPSTTDPSTTDPGTQPDPGSSADPGADNTTPGIGDIDPGQIFPDPSGNSQTGGQIAADGLPMLPDAA